MLRHPIVMIRQGDPSEQVRPMKDTVDNYMRL